MKKNFNSTVIPQTPNPKKVHKEKKKALTWRNLLSVTLASLCIFSIETLEEATRLPANHERYMVDPVLWISQTVMPKDELRRFHTSNRGSMEHGRRKKRKFTFHIYVSYWSLRKRQKMTQKLIFQKKGTVRWLRQGAIINDNKMEQEAWSLQGGWNSTKRN